MTTASIHQPQYFPWLPYFQKIAKSDCFVYLDNVQFQKGGVQNRNKIKGPNGPIWLTVPVSVSLGDQISAIKITDSKWKKKHIKSIEQYYRKSKYYYLFEELFKPVLLIEYQNLAELNIAISRVFLDFFEINTKIIKASDLGVFGSKETLVINICKKINASVYISGYGAKQYQSPESFQKNGIELQYHEPLLPVYNQLYEKSGFENGMSALDLVLNLGDDAKLLI